MTDTSIPAIDVLPLLARVDPLAILPETVGFERPEVLLVIPVAIVIVVAVAMLYTDGPRITRRRLGLVLSRTAILTLVLLAVAGPYLLSVSATPDDPSVQLVVDESDSMDLYDVDPETLASEIEAEGVPVTTTRIGSETRSPLGDQLLPLLGENEHLVVLSDGQVTEGRGLASVASAAYDTNATISAISLRPDRAERAVSIDAPATTSRGATENMTVSVAGVGEATVDLTVRVDDTVVHETTVSGQRSITVPHTFETVGDRQVTATIDTVGFQRNAVARASVRVVEPPEVLYVSRTEYPFQSYLTDLYDVTTADTVPDRETLDEYHSVVIQDVAAGDLGNVGALQSYVADGNGLVVVGGDNAYAQGGYDQATIGSMLPVRFQDDTGGRDIMIAIDVSGDAALRMARIRGLALDIVDQLGEDHNVGLIAFDSEAETIVPLGPLSRTEEDITESLRRLQAGAHADNIATGITASGAALPEGGELLLISEGVGTHSEPIAAAEELAADDIQITGVGFSRWREDSLMTSLVETTDGTYIQADNNDKIQLLFSDAEPPAADSLVRADANHFITRGIEPTASPDQVHGVSIKPGARLLVTTSEGDPAISTWRFGLGRVASVTTYDNDGSIGSLLQAPDSLMLSRTVNWGVGNPLRKQTGVIDLPDTRVGESTTAVYQGAERPTDADIQFISAGNDRYEATLTPSEAGFQSVLDTEYAVTYPEEYATVGQSEALETLVAQTDGETFSPTETAAIAEYAQSTPVDQRPTQRDVGWLFLLLALVILLAEVTLRRVETLPFGGPDSTTRREPGDD